MRVAGFGFRRLADVAALRDALTRAGGGGVQVLAATPDKAGSAALQALALELALPLRVVPEAALVGVQTAHRSARIMARFGTGSLAEAVALVAAGPGARLVVGRVVSRCGRATAAVAEGSDE